MASMFELLMELPLFQGVSHSKLAEIVGSAKFHFLKYPEGETIIRAGERCDHLAFVISGSVRYTVTNINGRFSVSQALAAPAVIAPDFLFGKITDYPCDVVALETTGILKISKVDYIKILGADPVFAFNYLNTLSVNAQKAVDGILSLTSGELSERIAFWIIALTQAGGTDICLTCKARDLSSIFGVQRSTFEANMRQMKEAGLIDYEPSQIRVADRSRMLALLQKNSE
ncbi:MAG: Crp/Fnr family transcriptional regulator [Bacteroidales bacterium]|nr:Crp/Fnr family transcriptional regulator [Bacteroidales bacterium]